MGKFTIQIKENKIKDCDYELIKIDSSLSKNVEVDLLVEKALENKLHYSLAGVIIIWDRCVPASINQGIPGACGLVGRPVVSPVI